MKTSTAMLELDYGRISEKIEDFIRGIVQITGKDGVIVGLSGGIDSSTTATLSVRALGSDRVFGLLMPERDSDPQNFKDAKHLASKLKIEYEVLDLTPILRKIGIYDILPDNVAKNKKLLLERLSELERAATFELKPEYLSIVSIKSGKRGWRYAIPKLRLRSIMLYLYALPRNLLVAGTLCKSEYLTSFYDEHGDGACDIAPIRGLYKTQVRQLARYLGVPKRITSKPSSPDIFPSPILTDEALMGISYETLDSILFCLEKGMKSNEIARDLEIDENTVKKVENTVEMAKLRREMPFVAEI
jgi:NAD+ synthase